MSALREIATIARWEVKKTFSIMSRDLLPVAIVLFILLVAVTGFAAQSGLHIQDGMYRLATDDPQVATVFSSDARFSVYTVEPATIPPAIAPYDIAIVDGVVYAAGTDKGKSAQKTLERDYAKYKAAVYTGADDLFAAYPLWIDTQTVASELNFSSPQAGRFVPAPPGRRTLVPAGTVEDVPTPSPTLGVTQEDIRAGLVASSSQNTQVTRYTDVLSSRKSVMGTFVTPDQLSPPLPFDAIILIFVFIFPLYFTSQFFMMSIMNERIERQGEPLLSTPVKTAYIITGKMLPYFFGMLALCAVLTLYIRAPLSILLPLVPVILFFLASALVIGMLARSFKELSFISIFFSTVATSYLFFPSIFANVHVISLISPLTLIVLTLEGTAWTAADYCYATVLFWLTSAVLFYIAARNFNEERLFSEKPLLPRCREFLAGAISRAHPYASLFCIALATIPFVFMGQMMGLVVLFNLPMPLSLVLLIVFAAFVEETAKAAGIYTLFFLDPAFFTTKRLVLACAATAFGFLVGEKLLLFATLAEITESVFGNVLFLSLGVIWLPFLLHFACLLIVAFSMKRWGRIGAAAGILAAGILHCGYNLYFLQGWLT
ncbi:MAG: PrsW family intramembrane metalloprotease [Methanoregula sp.]|jgi:ABC-type Na+ efflux pump permease subunit